MVRNSKNGFTLVELLVVMVILGIIAGMAFPLIRKITMDGENKKYTVYRDSLTSGAKVYVDSYGDDLFGHMKSGCAYIPYKELASKSLAKEISVDGITCDTEETYIKVIKIDNRYSYTTYMGCGNKKEGAGVNVVKRFPEYIPKMDEENCGYGKTTVSIKGNPDTTTVPEEKSLSVKVTLQSATGLLRSPNIVYGWSQKREVSGVTTWSKLNFKSPSRKEQEKIIFDENKSVEVLQSVASPNGATGDYYLIINIEELYDLAGMAYEGEKYVYLGPYRLDNVEPDLRDSRVVSSVSGYNSLDPRLELNATDNYTPEDKLKICISYDKDSCKKSATEIEKYNKYVKNKKLDKVATKYDGSVHKIFVTVADRAGNYRIKTFSYRVARKYKLTYNSNGGSACSPASKDAFENSSWGSLCTPRKSGYDFVGWSNKKDGTGTIINSSTIASKDMTVYAIWRAKSYKLTYNSEGGSACATKIGYYGNTWGGLCTPTRTSYIFEGWYTDKNGKGTLITSSTKVSSDLAVYAKWKLNEKTFIATLHYQNGAHLWNGGSASVKYSCKTTTGSCSINLPTVKNLPGHSGCKVAYSNLFAALGWSTNPNAKSGVTGNVPISSNVDYYSIIVPKSEYINAKRFTVEHYTCDGGKNGSSRNVYNRSAAKSNSLLSDKSYIVETHSFTWNGTWAVNTSAYNNCKNPSKDNGDCEWLYLVGKGGLCRKGADKPKNNLKECPSNVYIKATQLNF